MAYIGRGLDKISNVEKLDNLTFDGSSTSYSLLKGGVSFTPSSANNILLSIDGVVQAGNFTVSGSTIDFGTAVSASSTCDFILHYGVGLIITPADATVTTAKLNDASVSLAKLTATGTKDATTFLRGDNTFGVPPLGGITQADQWRLTASLNFSASITPITANLERSDTAGFNYIGTGMTESSGVFTFPSTGIWMIMIQAMVRGNGATANYASVHFQTTQNNSTYVSQVNQVVSEINSTGGYAQGFGVSFFDVTDTSTHKCRFGQDAESTTCQLWGDTNIQSTGF